MTTQECLIFVKGEDKTKSIKSYRYDKDNHLVYVTFDNRKQFSKEYSYNEKDFIIIYFDEIVEIRDEIVFKNGVQITGVCKLQFFSHCDTRYCRICYDFKDSELVKETNIKVIASILNMEDARNSFAYLKEISKVTGLILDGENILEKNYDSIDFIREDSVLASFLSGELRDRKPGNNLPIVYPFGFNLSQKKAVDNALKNSISIIEGPPGTGKTQTILNIIANVVMRGESVAVVSSNNSATENVFEKLKKYSFDFIAAPLGNSANKKSFIESQDDDIPNMCGWLNQEYTTSFLHKRENELDEKLEAQKRLSILSAKYDALKREASYYDEYFKSLSLKGKRNIFAKHISASRILKYIVEYEYIIQANSKISFWKRLYLWVKYRSKISEIKNVSSTEFIACCKSEYYSRALHELNDEIEEIKNKLLDYDFDSKMIEYAEVSKNVFKSYLAKKYLFKFPRKYYNIADLWMNSEEFIDDYPVVLSTTYSLRSSLSNRFVYDYVIVDEASQVDLATGALALSCAKNAVIVGDLKQLPNGVNEEQKVVTDYIFNKYKLSDGYRYSKYSLLSSIVSLITKSYNLRMTPIMFF